MEKPQEAAAEAEAQRRRCLHVVGKTRIVEAKLAHRLAQILKSRGIDREETGEDHGLRRLEARQRLGGGALLVGHGVADAGIGDLLDGGGEEADLARAKAFHQLAFWP